MIVIRALPVAEFGDKYHVPVPAARTAQRTLTSWLPRRRNTEQPADSSPFDFAHDDAQASHPRPLLKASDRTADQSAPNPFADIPAIEWSVFASGCIRPDADTESRTCLYRK
jgi:hypothetical protein